MKPAQLLTFSRMISAISIRKFRSSVRSDERSKSQVGGVIGYLNYVTQTRLLSIDKLIAVSTLLGHS